MRETRKEKARRALAILEKLVPRYGRAAAGKALRRDPFRALVAAVLSHRTRDENTDRASARLLARYPNPHTLAGAEPKEVQSLIKEVGFYRVKAARVREIARILVSDFGGSVPDNYEDLLSLPGVGRKTAGCVLVFGFGKQALPVDTHVHRISNRLGLVKTTTPPQTEQALLQLLAPDRLAPVNAALVEHGKTACRPLSPLCSACPVQGLCPRVGVKRHR